jgi:hypothetical protein
MPTLADNICIASNGKVITPWILEAALRYKLLWLIVRYYLGIWLEELRKITINLSQDIQTFKERCAEILTFIPVYHVTSLNITFMIMTFHRHKFFLVLNNISAHTVQSLIRLAQWFPSQVAMPVQLSLGLNKVCFSSGKFCFGPMIPVILQPSPGLV